MDFKLKQTVLEDIERVKSNKETENHYGGPSDFWYALTKRGGFRLIDIIDNKEQLEKIGKAIDLLKDLEGLYEMLNNGEGW